jgi:hypothetical protein
MKHLVLNYDKENHQINILKIHEGTEDEANVIAQILSPKNYKVINDVNRLIKWLDEIGIEEYKKIYTVSQIINRTKLRKVWAIISIDYTEGCLDLLGIYIGKYEDALREGRRIKEADVYKIYDINTIDKELPIFLRPYFDVKTAEDTMKIIMEEVEKYK